MYNYLTEDSIKKLEDEIEYRKVFVRKEINEDLKEAKAHGDLSENFEYKAAKRDRARNESRIRFLTRMIKTAKIITDNTKDDEVGLNKNVTLNFIDDGFSETFFIVTTIDADPLNNKISIESPLGKAIFKHKVGDVLLVNSPEEKYSVKILSIIKEK